MSYYGIIEHYDSAATTPVDERVIKAMIPYLHDRSANSSALYGQGRKCNKAIEDAKAVIAGAIQCSPDEVYFTSGGTESNNWVMRGVNLQGKSVAVSATEHMSVMRPAEDVSEILIKIGVGPTGAIDLDCLETTLQSGMAGLVSVHWVNNETGTIQPVSRIYEMCREHGVLFHTDATQAFGKIPITFDADFMTVSAHKLHGPKGIGALIVKGGTGLAPFIMGGGQQGGMRAGTLPVHQIVGFGKAVELIPETFAFNEKIKYGMRDILGVFNNYGNGQINSDKNRVKSMLNITLLEADANDVAALMASRFGYYLSKGAACSCGMPSHVLRAQGLSDRMAGNSIRISINRFNSISRLGVFPHNLQKCIYLSKESDK